MAVGAGHCFAGGVPPPVELEPIEVEGQRRLQDAPTSASEGYVTQEQLAERPIDRSGELLEFVPGMMVTQHSGEAKANQYFLRGFNLDHGTDFYADVDGVPVNMRTHGHGQGYADINFIIPELIGSLAYRKGPYFADVGDFGAAGSARLRYVDALPHEIARVTAGSFGYLNGLVAGSPSVGQGDLVLALEGTAYDGPYDVDQKERRLSGLARYNVGDRSDGFTVALSGYGIGDHAPDQIPLRAVQGGQIGRFGFIDPTDSASVRRFSLSTEWRGSSAKSNWSVVGYALYYKLDLFSDFTYFLRDPVNGDQFEQFDDRRVVGLSGRRYWLLPTSIPMDLELGLQNRYDDILPVGLYDAKGGQRLDTVRQDRVEEVSVSPYLQSTQRWLPLVRSELGLRTDTYFFDVRSDRPENSGNRHETLTSPKAALIFGPWAKTEYFADYGEGFHSNDARGVTLKVDPRTGTPLTGSTVTPLVKAQGGEMGAVSELVPDVRFAFSLWTLHLDSELVYSGDSGTSDPSGASSRRGVELSTYYVPASWLAIDADAAFARARLDSPAGNRIPNAIENAFGLGVTLAETSGWTAGVRVRRLGPAPLIEDNSARSNPTTVVNAQVGYRFASIWTATLAGLNLLNSRDNDITYYYVSRLQGEPSGGIADYHFHPVEPRMVRLGIQAAFK